MENTDIETLIYNNNFKNKKRYSLTQEQSKKIHEIIHKIEEHTGQPALWYNIVKDIFENKYEEFGHGSPIPYLRAPLIWEDQIYFNSNWNYLST